MSLVSYRSHAPPTTCSLGDPQPHPPVHMGTPSTSVPWEIFKFVHLGTCSYPFQICSNLLPPANEVWRKVIFLQASVCPPGGGSAGFSLTEAPWTKIPPGQRHPWTETSQDGKESAARILRECILVFCFCNHSVLTNPSSQSHYHRCERAFILVYLQVTIEC